MPRFIRRVVVAALLLLVPSISSAQIGGQGSIQGTVLDTSKAALPGATVTATNVATGVDTVRQTTAAGVYALTPLQPGTYRVTVSLDGFGTFIRDGIIVDGLAVVGLNVTLQVGGLTQEVLVSAAPPPLASADARLGQTIRNDVYTALPLVMNTGGPRDPTAFMSLMPGVQSIGRWGNVMGGQDFTTDMYLEGIPITNAVVQGEGRNLSYGISVEAIDQFQVETSGTAVMFNGQGASNYIMKSGTNQFRMSAFEFFRNKALDAKAYFATIKPDDNQSEYGVTAGGPIQKEPDVFLRDLRRVSRSPADRVRADVGPDSGAAKRRFQRVAGDDLRSADHEAEPERYRLCPGPVSQQRHSAGPDFVDLAVLPVVPARADHGGTPEQLPRWIAADRIQQRQLHRQVRSEAAPSDSSSRFSSRTGNGASRPSTAAAPISRRRCRCRTRKRGWSRKCPPAPRSNTPT